MNELVFYLGFALLLSHELDAVANHEWRVLPMIRSLADEQGMVVFIGIHVPILAALVASVGSSNQRTRALTRLGIAAFLVLHGLLHALFSGHSEYEFSSLMSNMLIFGGALLGLIYLALEMWERYGQSN